MDLTEAGKTMDRIKEDKLAPQSKPRLKLAATLNPRSRRTRAIALAVALALGGGAYYGWTAWSDSAATIRYATAVVQRGDLEDTVTATGILQPRDYVDV